MSTNLTVVVDGKVARDAEWATRADGTVVEPKFAKFSIPYSPYTKRNPDGTYPDSDTYWLEVTASGTLGETAVRYYKKGTHVSVTGQISRIMPRIKDGQLVRDPKTQNPIVNVNLRASSINFVGSRQDGAAAPAGATAAEPAAPEAVAEDEAPF